jgi:hypothetical protein
MSWLRFTFLLMLLTFLSSYPFSSLIYMTMHLCTMISLRDFGHICVVALVRLFRLTYWFRAKGLWSSSLASPYVRRKCIHKRTCPPTILSLFLFPLHSYLFIYLNKYLHSHLCPCPHSHYCPRPYPCRCPILPLSSVSCSFTPMSWPISCF